MPKPKLHPPTIEFDKVCEAIEQAAHDARAAAGRGEWRRAAGELETARCLAQDAGRAARALMGAPAGYVIRVAWISPTEGYEYRVSLMGHDEVLAYRKSERAAVNFANRHADDTQQRPA